jgi:phage FluMu protein Com
MLKSCYRLRCDKCKQPLAFLYAGKNIHLTIKCHRCGFVTDFALATVELSEFRVVEGPRGRSEEDAALRTHPARMAGN